MQLSRRLSLIDSLITKPYSSIWDCCCDHGLLGMTLLKRDAAEHIYFVDIVEPVMAHLTRVLHTHFGSPKYRKKWSTLCMDIMSITIPPPNHSQSAAPLIIIAGVGGDKLIEFVQAIVRQHPKTRLEFMLCPVHHNYKVRRALMALKFFLIDEHLVEENRRYYEVLHVIINPQAQEKVNLISAVGSLMWDLSRAAHQDYLKQTISHYQRIARKPNSGVESIINAYRQLNLPDQ